MSFLWPLEGGVPAVFRCHLMNCMHAAKGLRWLWLISFFSSCGCVKTYFVPFSSLPIWRAMCWDSYFNPPYEFFHWLSLFFRCSVSMQTSPSISLKTKSVIISFFPYFPANCRLLFHFSCISNNKYSYGFYFLSRIQKLGIGGCSMRIYLHWATGLHPYSLFWQMVAP